MVYLTAPMEAADPPGAGLDLAACSKEAHLNSSHLSDLVTHASLSSSGAKM